MNTAAALDSRVDQLERTLKALLERVDQLEGARGPAPYRGAVRSLQAEQEVDGDDNWSAPVQAITTDRDSGVPDAETPAEPDSF